MDGPKDPWPHVLSLPERFVGDPASLARDNIIATLTHSDRFHQVNVSGPIDNLSYFKRMVSLFNDWRYKCFITSGPTTLELDVSQKGV